jgi:hypothetical protein
MCHTVLAPLYTGLASRILENLLLGNPWELEEQDVPAVLHLSPTRAERLLHDVWVRHVENDQLFNARREMCAKMPRDRCSPVVANDLYNSLDTNRYSRYQIFDIQSPWVG